MFYMYSLYIYTREADDDDGGDDDIIVTRGEEVVVVVEDDDDEDRISQLFYMSILFFLHLQLACWQLCRGIVCMFN